MPPSWIATTYKGQAWLNFEDAWPVLLDPHETTYKYDI